MVKNNRITIVFAVILAAVSLILFSGYIRLQPANVEAKITPDTDISILNEDNPQIRAAITVQDRHKDKLMAISKVIGTATGISENGRPAILVFTKDTIGAGVIPERLEGIPVRVKVTGEFIALRTDNTVIFPLPVPIGVSTGNGGECSAGTIGARVKDNSGNVYALSNNHVYALENTAAVGSTVLQPGLYDTQCMLQGNNSIGSLYDYVPINFGSNSNTVDAAIALSSTSVLGNATPLTGYGVPNSATVGATLGQGVKKYGRTSSLTKGTVSGINATITVNYGSSGTATFVNQIIVSSSKPFIKAGDSGSLLVTNNANANPVGLLFAGNSSGTYAIANRIDDVLSSFGVTIDGK